MPETLGNITKSTFLKLEEEKLSEELVVAERIGTLTLDADLIAANVVNVSVNGEAIAPVTYGTSHAATMTALAAAVAALASVASAEVSSARVITFIPVDQTVNPSITNAVVTGGVTQAGITTAVDGHEIFMGMPVKMQADGKVKPLAAGDSPHLMVGVAVFDAKPGSWDKSRTTVWLRGFVQTFAQAADNLVAGPVKYAGYDSATGRNKYSDDSVTTANCVGWALEPASQGDEFIVCLAD